MSDTLSAKTGGHVPISAARNATVQGRARQKSNYSGTRYFENASFQGTMLDDQCAEHEIMDENPEDGKESPFILHITSSCSILKQPTLSNR